jgi:hypothetical protein
MKPACNAPSITGPRAPTTFEHHSPPTLSSVRVKFICRSALVRVRGPFTPLSAHRAVNLSCRARGSAGPDHVDAACVLLRAHLARPHAAPIRVWRGCVQVAVGPCPHSPTLERESISTPTRSAPPLPLLQCGLESNCLRQCHLHAMHVNLQGTHMQLLQQLSTAGTRVGLRTFRNLLMPCSDNRHNGSHVLLDSHGRQRALLCDCST